MYIQPGEYILFPTKSCPRPGQGSDTTLKSSPVIVGLAAYQQWTPTNQANDATRHQHDNHYKWKEAFAYDSAMLDNDDDRHVYGTTDAPALPLSRHSRRDLGGEGQPGCQTGTGATDLTGWLCDGVLA